MPFSASVRLSAGISTSPKWNMLAASPALTRGTARKSSTKSCAQPAPPEAMTGTSTASQTAESCFFNSVYESGEQPFSVDGLYELLLGRKRERPEGSYTTYLFEKGRDKILKKVGEESTEVIIAGKADDRAETVYELADLAYHALVLMADMGITPDDVRRELAGRHVIDHKVKQEKMA